MKQEYRKFSFIWTFIFIFIGVTQNINTMYIVAIVFFMIGILKPTILASFYKIQTKIGEIVGGLVSKVIMFVLYFGLFTPIAVFLKILGKDLLNKKVNKSVKSYWINRKTQPESMRNQF